MKYPGPMTLTATMLIALTMPTLAQANTSQPGNCAVYAEELSKAVKADDRVTGEAESEAVETLDTYGSLLRQIVADGMEQTYAQSKAFGWDKAKVDAMMAENESAIRTGFYSSTMEKDRVYTDHLMTIMECTQNTAKQGKLGPADVDKMSKRLTAVLNLIR